MSEKVAGSHININWPRSGIKGKIGKGESSVFALLTKIEPTVTENEGQDIMEMTEINKLNFELKVKDDVEAIARQAEQDAKAAVNPEQPKSTEGPITSEPYTEPQNGADDDFTNIGHEDIGDFAVGADEKSCGACTMLNPISASVCSICNT
jgi:hypothetical protein